MRRIPINHLNKLIKRFGTACFATVKGFGTRRFYAFVEDANRTRRGITGSKMLDDFVALLGHDRHKRLVMYAIYDEFWDSDDEIRILYHGKSYTVEYDSVMFVGDRPAYVWALLLPVARARSTDYSDIDTVDDDEYSVNDDSSEG